ncbi:hypothetical protein KAT51_07200 [bacterium]|nr:hypothetical protein [bacterium]
MKTKYSLLIMGCVSIAIISIAASFYMPYYGEETSVTINSAKQLKIEASEIGTGWEGVFEYISDPVKTFEETCEYLESMKEQMKKNKMDEEIFEENLKKEKVHFLELSDKLRECGVKDGYVLQLNKKIDGFTKGYAEVDVFVFNNIDGADEFFEYMKNRKNGSSISGIGDEAALSSTGYSYIVRTSNAFIEVVVFDEKETGRIIAEKVVEKTGKC